MKKARPVTRLAVARLLQDLALRIAAGRPVRVGGASARIPEKVALELELETSGGVTELEVELTWASRPRPARRRPPRS